jgi:hypothetical protein
MRALLLTLVLFTGCVRHVPISTAELSSLNGFGGAPQEGENAAAISPEGFHLVDRDGESHAFNADSKLYLVDDHGKRKGGQFKLVSLEEKTLTGELSDGTKLVANLDTVDRAELDVKDTAGAVGLGIGIALGLAAVVVVGVMAMNGLP